MAMESPDGSALKSQGRLDWLVRICSSAQLLRDIRSFIHFARFEEVWPSLSDCREMSGTRMADNLSVGSML
jgi:hypothetical protein